MSINDKGGSQSTLIRNGQRLLIIFIVPIMKP